jgi:tetratricopeptide (TPR) repeat protein
MFHEAAEAWKRQDYQLTIETLERAVRLDPANVRILLDLGRAYGLRYEYAAAERCFEKAVRVASNRAEVMAEAGRRCQEFDGFDMARRYFDLAAQQNGVTAGVFVSLAELSERHARLDDAEHWVERALAAHAEHPAALLTRARLRRLRGELEEAESGLRSLLTRPSVEPSIRVRSWYELAAGLDRQARYDEAMTALLEAKSLLRPAATTHLATLQGIQDRVREMENTISSNVLKRWFDSLELLQPARRLAVLCGHPRSGTTLLEQVLDSHNEIVSAEETHLFHDEAYLPLSRGFSPETSVLAMLEAAPVSGLQQARENYFRFTAAFLGKPISNQLLVDKNPALNVLIPAVARIFPEGRLLVAIRDPRDVCLSCFMQPLALNPVSSAYLSLETTVIQYASVMGFWSAMRPRLSNAWMDIRYEDVVADLEGASRRLLKFLEVEWDAKVMRFHEHARNKPLRSPSYAEVTKPVYRSAAGRWRNYEKYLTPYLERLSPVLSAYGYS